MFLRPSFLQNVPTEFCGDGQVLRQRGEHPSSVVYIDSGYVVLGVREGEHMRHQLGMVQGPAWLDAAYVFTDQPCVVDMVTDGRVQLRRLARADFLHSVRQLPQPVQSLMQDMAMGYCQQTDVAVSRLSRDAEARCAQWLLRHAQPDAQAGVLRVTLHQRKRSIAAQLGIAPETLSRVLRHLRELGLIAGTGNVLSLPKPSALQSVAGIEGAQGLPASG